MIQLTERQRLIIEDLLNNSSHIPAKALAKKFNVSVRTIRYDLDNIEYWLRARNIPLIKKPNAGVWLDLKDAAREELKREIGHIDPCEGVLSRDERHYLVLLELLKSVNPLTADFLADGLGVSRTTVIKDLRQIKGELKRYGVLLQGKPGEGYRITGDENNIRKLLGDLILGSMEKGELLELLSSLNKNNGRDNERSLFSTGYLKDISAGIKIEDIKRAINEVKHLYSFRIPDSSYVSLLVHIAIAIDRLIKGQKIELPAERIKTIKEHREYFIAEEIGNNLARIYRIPIPESEIANIAFHLLSANLKMEYLSGENIPEEEDVLKRAVDEMLENAGKLRDYLVPGGANLEKLKKDLLSHLKLTVKKHRLNIEIENPLLDQIKANYTDIFETAREMADIFALKTDIRLPETEIGYIALHLAAHIETYRQKSKKKALIVCTTGQGSAKILATRIKNRIPELEIKGINSVFELEEDGSLLRDVDFIVSTVHLKVFDKPVVKVSPIITNEELEKIRKVVYDGKTAAHSKEGRHENYILGAVMNVVDKYIDMEDRDKIRTELGYLTGFFVNNSEIAVKESEVIERFAGRAAMILVEINEMLKELEGNIPEEDILTSIWGIIIHIIMAIPRWEGGQYNKEIDVQKYKKENPEVYGVIRKRMDIISRKYGMDIPDSEVIAVMRYLI
ncbi:MAG: transcription antiterminator [Firmicutes bacterium]|nr:transcription antiterminator [Bacillota bacterium]